MTLLAVNSVGQINTLMDIITDEYRDKPVDLHQAFKATSMDVITAYCYAQSFDALHSPGFAHPMLLGMEAITATMTAVRHFPVLIFMHYLPEGATRMKNPDVVGFFSLQKVLGRQIDKILADPGVLETVHDTIYHRLLADDGERPSRKSLLEEVRTFCHHAFLGGNVISYQAQTFLIAGTDTTSNAMSIGFFHVLNDPSVRAKLVAELKATWPEKESPMPYDSLEKLSYLVCVCRPFHIDKIYSSTRLGW